MDKKKLFMTSAIAAAFTVGATSVGRTATDSASVKPEPKGKCVVQAAGESKCGTDGSDFLNKVAEQDPKLWKYISNSEDSENVKHSCARDVDEKGVHWTMTTKAECEEKFASVKSDHQEKMVWLETK